MRLVRAKEAPRLHNDGRCTEKPMQISPAGMTHADQRFDAYRDSQDQYRILDEARRTNTPSGTSPCTRRLQNLRSPRDLAGQELRYSLSAPRDGWLSSSHSWAHGAGANVCHPPKPSLLQNVQPQRFRVVLRSEELNTTALHALNRLDRSVQRSRLQRQWSVPNAG
jgi:hypothetical protein